MQPRFRVPLLTQIIVDKGGFQLQRLFRFFDELSRGSWEKKYIEGTDFDLTSSPAVVSTIRAWIRPYQDEDRVWSCDLGACYTVASGARTGVTATFTGIKFKNTAGLFQPVTGFAMDGTAPYPEQCYAELNTGNIILKHASATTTIYGFSAHGIELEEQPDFAE